MGPGVAGLGFPTMYHSMGGSPSWRLGSPRSWYQQIRLWERALLLSGHSGTGIPVFWPHSVGRWAVRAEKEVTGGEQGREEAGAGGRLLGEGTRGVRAAEGREGHCVSRGHARDALSRVWGRDISGVAARRRCLSPERSSVRQKLAESRKPVAAGTARPFLNPLSVRENTEEETPQARSWGRRAGQRPPQKSASCGIVAGGAGVSVRNLDVT